MYDHNVINLSGQTGHPCRKNRITRSIVYLDYGQGMLKLMTLCMIRHCSLKYQSVSETSFPASALPDSCDSYTRFRLHRLRYPGGQISRVMPFRAQIVEYIMPFRYICQKACFSHALVTGIPYFPFSVGIFCQYPVKTGIQLVFDQAAGRL